MTGPAVDERFMARALELAERGRGLTSPNPMVGAVVVGEGAVVGEGFHAAAGRPHAEIEALAVAGERARGATLYVTLEPCAHYGRTPPCAPAVVTAGVRRVVAAMGDPSAQVSGRGFAILRSAGLEVTVGVQEAEATRQNRVFLTAIRRSRPHVTLKAAMTLDGKLADLHGSSRWITGEAARQVTHRLRSEVDAIVVGIGTVLADDPALTVRLAPPWPREPLRIVLDRAARTPVAARLITAGAAERALIAVGRDADSEREAALRRAGATVVRLPLRDGRVDVEALLGDLFRRDVRGVLIEGGAEVNASFVEAGLVDRVAFFVAPRLLGGRQAPTAVGGRGLALKDALGLEEVTIRRVGDDLLIEGDVRRPDGG